MTILRPKRLKMVVVVGHLRRFTLVLLCHLEGTYEWDLSLVILSPHLGPQHRTKVTVFALAHRERVSCFLSRLDNLLECMSYFRGVILFLVLDFELRLCT
jgi:hypothetical protein